MTLTVSVNYIMKRQHLQKTKIKIDIMKRCYCKNNHDPEDYTHNFEGLVLCFVPRTGYMLQVLCKFDKKVVNSTM